MDEKLVKLLKQYGETPEAVIAWAHQKIPNFVNNEQLMTVKYLIDVKGVNPKILGDIVAGPKLEVTSTLADLNVGKWETVKVAVVSLLGETRYMGCPVCFKKPDPETKRCATHDEEAIEHSWKRYLIGDTYGGSRVMSVPPKNSHLDLLDKIILVRGQLNEQLELFGQMIQVTEEEFATATQVPSQTTTTPAPTEVPLQKELLEEFKRTVSIFKVMDLHMVQAWIDGKQLKISVAGLCTQSGCKLQGNFVTA